MQLGPRRRARTPLHARHPGAVCMRGGRGGVRAANRWPTGLESRCAAGKRASLRGGGRGAAASGSAELR